MDCPIREAAKRNPDAIAMAGPDGDCTWRDYNVQVTAMESRLASVGVVPGNRVAFRSTATPAACLLLPALFRRGAVAIPLNPRFPDSYAAPLLERAGCSVWIGAANEEAPPLPAGARRVVLPVPIRKKKEAGSLFYDQGLDRPATIVFTSGSRGAPKAAVHSLRNHRVNAQYSNRNIPLEPGDRWLLSLPLFHVSGLGVLFRCWEASATVVLPMPEESLAETAERQGITHLSLVPVQLYRMLKEPAAIEALSRMKAILLGGAAASENLVRRARAMGLPICPTYGLTETTSQVSTVSPGASLEECLSSGRPLVPGSIRISEEGEIWVGGPARFLGYANPDGLETPFSDGYFATGDRGHFDAQGCLHVAGRIDCMFVVGGENVQPETVEARLMAIEGIEQAVVVPVLDEEYGSIPVAVMRGPEPLDEDRLRAALAESLPKYMIPRRFLPSPKEYEADLKPPRPAMAAYAADQLAKGE